MAGTFLAISILIITRGGIIVGSYSLGDGVILAPRGSRFMLSIGEARGRCTHIQYCPPLARGPKYPPDPSLHYVHMQYMSRIHGPNYVSSHYKRLRTIVRLVYAFTQISYFSTIIPCQPGLWCIKSNSNWREKRELLLNKEKFVKKFHTNVNCIEKKAT